MEYRKPHIMVIGDIMLDHYLVGSVNRLSPEAPVPIVNVNREYHRLGGCGNVVSNLTSIGCRCSCISSIGEDKNGELIEQVMESNGIHFLPVYNNGPTTTKTRIVEDQRHIQMLRYDLETIEERFIERIFNKIEWKFYDLIVVSDYNKGCITPYVMKFLKSLHIPIIVDPKPRPESSELYKDVFLITPNEKEYREMDKIDCLYTLETLGSKGMVLMSNDSDFCPVHISCEPVEVYSVCGAGDTVVASIAACISNDIDIVTSAKIANKCAHYVVTKPDTVTLPKEIFEEAVETFT